MVPGLGFKGSGRLFLSTQSRSMNCVDAPLSIIADPVVSLFSRTGIIIGSLHPRSAELIPVDSNPLVPHSVSGNLSTKMHAGFSIRLRISCAMQSPVLIRNGVSQLLIS